MKKFLHTTFDPKPLSLIVIFLFSPQLDKKEPENEDVNWMVFYILLPFLPSDSDKYFFYKKKAI